MQNTVVLKKDTNPSGSVTLRAASDIHDGSSSKQVRMTSLFFAAVLAVMIGMLLITWSPQTAHARSYSMPEVTIDATAQSNGDLNVVEQRTFDFDGSYTAVWWSFDNLPSGAYIKVNGVTLQQGGITTTLSSTAFNLKWRDSGGPGTTSYSLDSPKNTVYLFMNVSDEQVTATLDYTVVDAIARYQDTSELYWQFVGDGWAEDSDNVTMNLTLPIPQGTAITPGETIRAWGHGPLDATVKINDNGTVTYTAPSVAAGSFAEARVLFPASWTSGIAATDANAHFNTQRVDSVLSEEQSWSDQANNRRIVALGALIATMIIAILACLWALWSFRRYGKELEPQFKEKYWRDIPVEGEHPAVVGRLCRFDAESNNDLTATIMHLVNAGAIQLNKGSYDKPGLFGGTKPQEDYYLTRVENPVTPVENEIDRKAMEFLFDVVGQGEDSIWMTSISQFAEKNPDEFSRALDEWQGLVSARSIQGEYFESYSQAKKGQMLAVGVAVFILSFAIGYFANNFFALLPGIVSMIILIVVSRYMDRRTQKGADAYARCKALEHWLTDFSALKERPTLDIKVWGEFMVYAYIFGVAEEVIKELRNAVPEIFEDDPMTAGSVYYVPWWVMYSSSWHGSTLPSFDSVMDNSIANSISAMSSAAEGSFSDAGGFGGGFSGGGGGGFGGGGGAR